MIYYPLENRPLTHEAKDGTLYANTLYKTIHNQYLKKHPDKTSAINVIERFSQSKQSKQELHFIEHLDVPNDEIEFNIIVFCHDALDEITQAVLENGAKAAKLRRFLYHKNLQNVIFLVSKECECDSPKQKCAGIRDNIIEHIGKNCQTEADRLQYQKHSSKIQAYCIQDKEALEMSKENHFVMISPLDVEHHHQAQLWLEQHSSKAEKITHTWGSKAWTTLSQIVKVCLEPYEGVWEKLNCPQDLKKNL